MTEWSRSYIVLALTLSLSNICTVISKELQKLSKETFLPSPCVRNLADTSVFLMCSMLFCLCFTVVFTYFTTHSKIFYTTFCSHRWMRRDLPNNIAECSLFNLLKLTSFKKRRTLRATWALLFCPMWPAAVDWPLLLDGRSLSQ